MPDEVTNQELGQMMMAVLEQLKITDSDIKSIKQDIVNIKEHAIKTDIKLEHDIEPKLQLLLENQGSISDNSKKIAAVEQRQDELEDKVDGLGYAVQELQKKMA